MGKSVVSGSNPTKSAYLRYEKESNQYLSKINENFEDRVAANDPVFNDNILVHDILMDDTNTDGADAGGTLDDDTLVDNYIFDDDDYNYKFI
ncbi:unnamed protein product [Rotaria sp. Silwood1]|nr:unnamed protein product [Rotaria sp. Silwood1]